MTSYGGKELANAFRTVRKNTIQVAEDIPESKYGFVAAPDVRSVGRMLTHIAIATRIPMARRGTVEVRPVIEIAGLPADLPIQPTGERRLQGVDFGDPRSTQG